MLSTYSFWSSFSRMRLSCLQTRAGTGARATATSARPSSASPLSTCRFALLSFAKRCTQILFAAGPICPLASAGCEQRGRQRLCLSVSLSREGLARCLVTVCKRPMLARLQGACMRQRRRRAATPLHCAARVPRPLESEPHCDRELEVDTSCPLCAGSMSSRKKIDNCHLSQYSADLITFTYHGVGG